MKGVAYFNLDAYVASETKGKQRHGKADSHYNALKPHLFAACSPGVASLEFRVLVLEF